MRFSELIRQACPPGTSVRGEADISNVQIDSRRCGSGSCFVALRGTAVDGGRFIPAAIDAGAAAVVCEDASAVGQGTPVCVLPDTRRAAGPLAQAVAGWPARRLRCVGITGTNGKTTVAHLLTGILREIGQKPAMLGTISYSTGERTLPARTTTPDPVSLAEMTAEMVSAGRTHLVMEVSSHALDQHRTAGVEFEVGVFTNLTGDHLDYHGGMDAYRKAKGLLFRGLGPKATAVLNRDAPASEAFAEATEASVLWYGLSPAADLWASIERIDADGTTFSLRRGEDRAEVRTRLIGRHNVYNALAAMAAAEALGVETVRAAEAIASIESVPGRLQRVPSGAPFRVFVDYAHTDDALANVLGSLRPITGGRILLVFGCGGDRDRTKRPRMARVAQDMADRLFVTSDNPRGEKPEAIIEDILAGLDAAARSAAVVAPDRRQAIGLALAAAREQDVVLIAGKGHETHQVIGSRRTHFDDAEVAGEFLREMGL